MRKSIWATVIVAGIILLVYLANFLTLKMQVSSRLSEDSRNEVVEIGVRYDYYVNPSVIVISLDDCSGAAPVDILRALLQTAEQLQSRDFSRVELHNGYDHRFTIDGDYFQELGAEYDFQNPVYTARTLPEEIYKPDGTQAYFNVRGGLAGLAEQMDTFQEFTADWCE